MRHRAGPQGHVGAADSAAIVTVQYSVTSIISLLRVFPYTAEVSRWPCALALATFLHLSGCLLSTNRDYRLFAIGHKQILLVSDSVQVRRLIADEAARQVIVDRFWTEHHSRDEESARILDEARHPDLYPPGRNDFLTTIATMPGLYVPSGSYCRVVEQSKAGCARLPFETGSYVLVHVTTGAARGVEGWVCSDHAPPQWP